VLELGPRVSTCSAIASELPCCCFFSLSLVALARCPTSSFRPDYAKLNILKIQFPTVPILAVTATATDKVAQDCQGILSIRGCQFFKCSFNRPNLHFSVRHKSSVVKEVAADMYEYIRSIGHLDSSGIVYCYSKKETVELSSMLSALGLSCDFYHSDVSPEHKQRLHHRWVQNRVKIIVATNAFGLGINKPDVRFVLHHTFPAGISLYYQEGGRAGRDGLNAYCCLWYSPRDLSRQSIRVYAKQDMPTHLYPMVAYCHTQDQCRR
jgi:ATP-dependent DNA helicase Q1